MDRDGPAKFRADEHAAARFATDKQNRYTITRSPLPTPSKPSQ